MAFSIAEPNAYPVAIGNTDSGKVLGTRTTTASPSIPLGTIVRGIDPTLGMGEFIFLQGAASIAVGELCTYDGTTFTAIRATTVANQARPVAVSMAATNTSTLWGWFQISGTATVKKRAVIFAPKVAVGVGSTGKLGATASGKEVQNMRTANTASVVSATTTVVVVMDRPHLQGRVT